MTFSANQQHVVNVGWLQIFTICNGTSDTSINNQADVSPLSIDQEEELETSCFLIPKYVTNSERDMLTKLISRGLLKGC